MKIIQLGGIYFPVLTEPFTLENNLDKTNHSLVVRIKLTQTNLIVARQIFHLKEESFGKLEENYKAFEHTLKGRLNMSLGKDEFRCDLEELVVSTLLGMEVYSKW